jgi:hypothetical protein
MNTRFGCLTALGLAWSIAGCGTSGGAIPSSPPDATSTTPAPTATIAPTTTAAPTATWPRNLLDVPACALLGRGTYYDEPESIPMRVVFTIAADGWLSCVGLGKPDQGPGVGYRHVHVMDANVTNVVVDGCTDHGAPNPPIGPTVDDLATALAALPPFLVTKPPRNIDIYGYHGKYLQIAVPDMPLEVVGDESYFPDCSERELKSFIGWPLSYAFYGYTEPGQLEEFWILDVEGRRLVIEAHWSPGSPKEDIAEMRAILDSIKIEP